MEICILADALAAAASQGIGFDKFVLPRKASSSKSNRRPTCSGGSGFLQISEVFLPVVDAVATPPVRSNPYRVSRRILNRKMRRTRRRSSAGGSDGDGGVEDGFFGDGGGDGPFGGSGAGAGGGWNFDGFGGFDWDDSSSSSSSDLALDFFYEVLSWIALSNCVHFAFKRVLRIVADGAVGCDGSKEKFPMRLTPMC